MPNISKQYLVCLDNIRMHFTCRKTKVFYIKFLKLSQHCFLLKQLQKFDFDCFYFIVSIKEIKNN